MKVGDLVKMKYEMWWKVRDRKKDYFKNYGIVYEIYGNAFKVLMPDNTVKNGLVDQWEKVK